ncbi:hypothetical protein [Glutamicibacter sp. NPDC127525]|uniref:hypothetical protein n=1 Tax=unclassified Glutamicibacter TaxID=2627139 RepID=UPI0036389372
MIDPLIDIELEIIENGVDDWVLFLHIMGIINEAKGNVLSEDEAIAEATGTVLALCSKGYAQLGRYTGPTSFVPWPDTGEELRARMEHQLENPPPGEGPVGNLMYIMLDILPGGQKARDEQSQ